MTTLGNVAFLTMDYDQILISEMFWQLFRHTLTEPHLILIFAHRVAEGTVLPTLRLGFNDSFINDRLDYVRSLSPKRDQDISKVKFDASGTNREGKSCLFYWSLSDSSVKEDIQEIFALLKRSGGVSLKLARHSHANQNVYTYALNSALRHWVDQLLSTPELNKGWSLQLPNLRTPLMHCVANGYAPLKSIIDQMDDESINVVDREGNTLLFYFVQQICIERNEGSLGEGIAFASKPNSLIEAQSESYSLFINEFKLLLRRPSLDLNPKQSIHRQMHKLPSIRRAFDFAANVFSVVPQLVNDALYHGYALHVPIGVCQIIADYYRMPYPIPPI